MTFGCDPQSLTDSFRRVIVKVMRTDQVWDVSLDIVVPLRDPARLLNDLCLTSPRCFRPVYLNHEFHASQALVSISRIFRLAMGRKNLCRTSHDSEATPYLVSVIDVNLDGRKGRRRWK